MTAIEIPTPDPRTLDEPAQSFALALSSQYAVKRLIGRGGMGVVYLARDLRLDRLVAIKTLPPQLAVDALVRERFLRETRTAGGMSHPNIVPIHGADEIAGHVFFVMSFVEGDSLATLVRANGRLEARAVVRYLRDVAAALAHAHKRGIIHRDIKAENILIDRATERALVTDFGIARAAEAQPLTATGQLLGTVYYVSPEQVQGDPVDARSDLYSLGVVGFLALTGRFPFDSDVASAVLVSHVTKAPPPVTTVAPDVPASLAVIIDRCLSKDPTRRYATADDMLAAIDAAIPEVDRHGALPMRPRLISDTEAHAVWHRAAELQALTGVQPRPDPVPRPRDEARDAVRTSGYQLDDVRSAAGEAGIGEKYVQHALIEHGLTAGAPAKHGLDQGDSRASSFVSRKSLWAGAPLSYAHQIVVDGEVQPKDFDRLLNVIWQGTGDMGTTMTQSRELSWYTDWQSDRTQVSVIPSGGRTTIRLSSSIRTKAAVAVSSIVGAIGGIAGFAAAVLVAEEFHGGDEGAFMTWGAVALASYVASRFWVKRAARNTGSRLYTLAETLAAKTRDAIRGDDKPGSATRD